MQLSFRIKKPSEFILEYLSDMQKYVSVHPVISRIDKTGKDEYLVHETLRALNIPFSFTYPVSIENTGNKTIVMRATVFRMTRIEMKFAVHESGEYSMVNETITIKSGLPVKFIMKKIFKNNTLNYSIISGSNKICLNEN